MLIMIGLDITKHVFQVNGIDGAGTVRSCCFSESSIPVLKRRILIWHPNEQSRRLETIPGVGPITASGLPAIITDASLFRSGRALAAWIGLVPRQNSSGGKERLGHISKLGT